MAAGGGAVSGSAALGLMMRARGLIAGALLVLAGTAWWASSGEGLQPLPPAPEPTASDEETKYEPAAAAPLEAAEQVGERATPLRAATESPVELAAEPETDRVSGFVRDPEGRPVAGATVYSFRPENRNARVLTRSRSDGSFSFQREGIDPALQPQQPAPQAHLGFAANGFLRSFVLDVDKTPPPERMDVILDRGDGLWGIVRDALGRPVSGVSMLAYTEGANIHHVSASQVSVRTRRASLSGPDAQFHGSQAVSDEQGRIAFTGLPAAGAEVSIRSLSPEWNLLGPTEARVGGPLEEWVVDRGLGVQLTVRVPGDTDEPLPSLCRAVFKVRLRFADGEEVDWGQWIGRGERTVTFGLDTEVLPQLAERTPVWAEFYGKVRVGEVEADWKAQPLEDPDGVYGIAKAEVLLDPGIRTEPEVVEQPVVEAPPEVPQAPLELIVQYADGTYYPGPVYVQWTSRPERGPTDRGGSRPQQLGPGMFRMEIPAGQVQLQVSEANPSGSLPPWTGSVELDPKRIGTAMVTLPASAGITLLRPEGWTGEWFIHASYRASEDQEWFGSWNYGTPEAQWDLNAVRPATWRFRLRQDRDQPMSEAIEVLVTVGLGERQRVQA